jgi:hypothetical protein
LAQVPPHLSLVKFVLPTHQPFLNEGFLFVKGGGYGNLLRGLKAKSEYGTTPLKQVRHQSQNGVGSADARASAAHCHGLRPFEPLMTGGVTRVGADATSLPAIPTRKERSNVHVRICARMQYHDTHMFLSVYSFPYPHFCFRNSFTYWLFCFYKKTNNHKR